MHPHEYAKMRKGVRDPDRVSDIGHSTLQHDREPLSTRGPPLEDDDILLTASQARARVGGVSAMCIWRWIRDPHVRFPAPLKINARSWQLGDLRRWQAERTSTSA